MNDGIVLAMSSPLIPVVCGVLAILLDAQTWPTWMKACGVLFVCLWWFGQLILAFSLLDKYLEKTNKET